MANDLAGLRRTFGKSVVAARALPAGYRITAEDIAFKKPGTGIPASRFQSVIGTTTKRPIAADTLLSEDDFE
jgi:N-acetylneuraminate synthase